MLIQGPLKSGRMHTAESNIVQKIVWLGMSLSSEAAQNSGPLGFSASQVSKEAGGEAGHCPSPGFLGVLT